MRVRLDSRMSLPECPVSAGTVEIDIERYGATSAIDWPIRTASLRCATTGMRRDPLSGTHLSPLIGPGLQESRSAPARLATFALQRGPCLARGRLAWAIGHRRADGSGQPRPGGKDHDAGRALSAGARERGLPAPARRQDPGTRGHHTQRLISTYLPENINRPARCFARVTRGEPSWLIRSRSDWKEAREQGVPWRKWGPYLSERQWGTVREDYSAGGDAWDYFTHDQARSRAYRWGEDGLAGISDDKQQLCFALALWNGKDPILKERLFGLTNSEGNHGEDVKEYYFYLDAKPTHSYMKYLYKYPQAAYPYGDLIETNRPPEPARVRVRAADGGCRPINRLSV